MPHVLDADGWFFDAVSGVITKNVDGNVKILQLGQDVETYSYVAIIPTGVPVIEGMTPGFEGQTVLIVNFGGNCVLVGDLANPPGRFLMNASPQTLTSGHVKLAVYDAQDQGWRLGSS